jgi:hypothetical protein
MEYLIGVPHWLDAVSPPLEKHIDRLIGIVESIIRQEQRQPAYLKVAPVAESSQPAELPPSGLPVLPTPYPSPKPETTPPEPVQAPLPKPERRIMAFPQQDRKTLVIAGIVLAAIIILLLGMQMGMFNLIKSPDMSDSIKSAPLTPVNYQSSDAVVNTIVLTTEPTQTLSKDTGLYVDVSKDDSNAMVLVQFNGGPGMGLVKENRVILTRSDGTVTEGKLDFSQRLSEVRLQGSRGTDRIQVQVTLFSGDAKTIVDKLLPYRTYR